MKMAGYIEKREFFEDSCKQFMANIFLKKIFDKSDLNDIEVTLTSILEVIFHRLKTTFTKYRCKISLM